MKNRFSPQITVCNRETESHDSRTEEKLNNLRNLNCNEFLLSNRIGHTMKLLPQTGKANELPFFSDSVFYLNLNEIDTKPTQSESKAAVHSNESANNSGDGEIVERLSLIVVLAYVM